MSSCSELEPYVLRVVGDDMAPEFPDGAIVIVEPAMVAPDGAFVVADTEIGTMIGRYRCVQAQSQSQSQCLSWLEAVAREGGRAQRLTTGESVAVRGIVVGRAARRGLGRKRYDPGR